MEYLVRDHGRIVKKILRVNWWEEEKGGGGGDECQDLDDQKMLKSI
jgi:hypothetical protein